MISGTVTIVTAKRDNLFVSVSSAWQQSTLVAEETDTFTGGTGRFVGASGGASLVSHLTVVRTSPLEIKCESKGSGTLVLARR